MKIYIAAPLFNIAEKKQNEIIDEVLQSCGHKTFLPQRDGGCFADLPEIVEGQPKAAFLHKKDIEALEWCDTLLFVIDGRVPDEGACFELGFAYAKGKKCVGFKTDSRSLVGGYDNLMLTESLEVTLHSDEELHAYFSSI